MTVAVMLYGNVDVRRLPKVADAEVKHNNRSVVHYFSKKPAEEITTFCRTFMTERVCEECPNDWPERWEKEGRYVLTFRQNVMECTLVAIKATDHLEVI